jgi:hypothetical protein
MISGSNKLHALKMFIKDYLALFRVLKDGETWDFRATITDLGKKEAMVITSGRDIPVNFTKIEVCQASTCVICYENNPTKLVNLGDGYGIFGYICDNCDVNSF